MAVKIQKRLVVLCLLALLMITGCSGSGKEMDGAETEEQTDTVEVVDDTQLYILLYNNTETKKLFLESVDTGRKEEYDYNGGTYIRNRYGDSTIVEELQVGEIVQISYTDDNVLTEVRMAADTFSYDDVTNFSIDAEKDMITVADTKYYYDEALKIFSDNGIIPLSEINDEKDTICIRGQGKEILTVVVTKGHGTVILKNTDVFVGGMITIGNVFAQEIKEDMEIIIPEGTYTLSAANNGYGGTMEITVGRFEEVTVDLNAIKGEGPSYCILTITVAPENAKVTLGGVLVDGTSPIKVQYGTYRLSVSAEGYESWSGRLVVSSSEAEIVIDLTETVKEETEETDKDTEKEETEETDKDAEKEETDTSTEQKDTTIATDSE